MRVLRQHGPEHCRVEDITNEAATAKGNFYRYFPTWEELLFAVRDHILDSYAASARERFSAEPADRWAAMDDEVDRFLDFQIDLGGLHDAVFHGPASERRPIDPQRSAAALIAWFIDAGIAAGEFDCDDVEATAGLLFHLVHGAADDIRAGADRETVRRALEQVIRRTLSSSPTQP